MSTFHNASIVSLACLVTGFLAANGCGTNTSFYALPPEGGTDPAGPCTSVTLY